ncbi:MAG TPA: DUF2461 domain-containing protein [Longimicrobium sp.]|nr:DUF2461 domain-containing protein [Longimicrobium sp.]
MDFARLAAYLGALAENNRKEWFEANRAEYQALRGDFTDFVGEVIGRIGEGDDAVRWMDPKDCIFRLHRDVRFSADKSPYKTTFSAFVSPRGRAVDGPGYYFHVDEKGTLFAAGGIYMPASGPLGRIREYIAEHPEKLRAVLRKRAFKQTFGEIQGERLKRPPRGYAEDAPMIETLQLKSFIVARERDVSAGAPDALPWLAETFRAMHPFIAWLREALAE